MLVKPVSRWTCLASGLLALGSAQAQVATYKENFNGITTNMSWTPLGSACLTASGNGPDNTGAYKNIPVCAKTIFSATGPTASDPAGAGALLLTPAKNDQTGAVLSNFTFDTSQGLALTYTTYTYGSDTSGTGGQGADGIVFILSDGTAPQPTVTGASGGAMGYSCVGNQRNAAPQGFANAYLGIGTDEWGNFLNSGDNGPKSTNSGIYNTNSAQYASHLPPGLSGYPYGSNTFSKSPNNPLAVGTGYQFQPNRIGIRGAGNVTSAAYGNNASTLRDKCQNSTTILGANGKSYPFRNYETWNNAYWVLPNSQKIATSATRLSSATPIAYKLTISPTGLLNFSFSYNNGTFQQVLSNTNITTLNPPLPAKLRFGFTAGTGGSNNVHEVGCFMVAPMSSSSSAGGNTTTGQVQIGSQIYLASYNADDWSGTVQAIPVVTNPGDEDLSLSSQPNWDANCVLTGGACAATGTGSGTTSAAGGASPAPLPGGNTTGSARVLLTSDSTTGAGIAFSAGALDKAETTALTVGATSAATTVAWLRGDRSTEQLWTSSSGNLRARVSVLGDIIHSSPVWVGPPQAGAYPDVFNDALNPSAAPTETAFSAYVRAAAMRQPVVYAGSNDGFVHGFRTGAIGGDGALPNDGLEVLGFMPSGALLRYAAGLASPRYSHDYVVDAVPVADDLFYGGGWHTWLVGGVGSAGQEIYALDVSDPGLFSPSQASGIVKGDWTPANTSALNRLNCTVGTPAIKRLHNGQWALIFGNGLPDAPGATPQRCRQTSGRYTAGIYIGLIDKNTGGVTFQFIDTNVGTAASPNGIAHVSPVDVDGDRITDYVYAGDLQGNLWRFDLTDRNPGNWKISTFGYASATPLFKAARPITTAPVVAAMQTGASASAPARMMVFFGTGQLTPATANGAAVYASGVQTFYGIWDWDLAAQPSWASRFAHLSGPRTIATTSLLTQTATQAAGLRTLSHTGAVCWADLAACRSTLQYGWKFNFPDTNEQVIYNPVAVAGAIIVNSAAPPTVNAQSCNPGQQSGWTMAFNPATGGGFAQDFFPNSNGVFGSASYTVAGVQQNAVGSPLPISHNGRTYVVSQTVSGTPVMHHVNPPGVSAARVSWRELRR